MTRTDFLRIAADIAARYPEHAATLRNAAPRLPVLGAETARLIRDEALEVKNAGGSIKEFAREIHADRYPEYDFDTIRNAAYGTGRSKD